jgi:hypothetical protein
MGSSRIARHVSASAALSLLSNEQLVERLNSAEVLSEGIGGTGARFEAGGVPVFAKRIPLTRLEQRNPHSTANLYGLPVFCHYGLGSPEGSAWRELVLHIMATGWVLAGDSEHFPLLHHWRILPVRSGRVPDRALDEDVEYWGGSAGVRERLTEAHAATDSLVLFCEYFPTTLHRWLPEHLDQAPRMTEQALAIVDFLGAQGVQHFDAHFENFLTDGDRLYLTDFGLALADRFALTAAERDFFAKNTGHDRAYVVMHLLDWLVTELGEADSRASRVAAVRRVAAGELVLPGALAELAAEHAPTAVVLNDFYDRLAQRRETPFPAAQLTG